MHSKGNMRKSNAINLTTHFLAVLLLSTLVFSLPTHANEQEKQRLEGLWRIRAVQGDVSIEDYSECGLGVVTVRESNSSSYVMGSCLLNKDLIGCYAPKNPMESDTDARTLICSTIDQHCSVRSECLVAYKLCGVYGAQSPECQSAESECISRSQRCNQLYKGAYKNVKLLHNFFFRTYSFSYPEITFFSEDGSSMTLERIEIISKQN